MIPDTEFEDRYFDVLQNIEFAIVSVDREREGVLVDYDVEKVLNALIIEYQWQVRHSENYPDPPSWSEVQQTIHSRVRLMCEWRLGHASLGTSDDGGQPASPDPISLEEIIACLKRIRKSIQTWNKRGGRRGYLTFINGFIA